MIVMVFFNKNPVISIKSGWKLQSYLKSMMRNKSEGKIILRGFVYLYNGIFNLDVSEDGNIEEQTSFVEPEIFLNRNFENINFSYSYFHESYSGWKLSKLRINL